MAAARKKFRPNDPPFARVGNTVGDQVEWVSISGDGSMVATPQWIYELPALTKIGRKALPPRPIAFAPDATRVARLGESTLEIRDARTGAIVATSRPTTSPVNGLAFSPDGTRVAVGEYERVIVFDANTAREVSRFAAFDRTVERVAYSPDGALIAAQSYDDVGVFNAKTGKRVAKLAGVESDTNLRGQGALAFMHDGRLIATLDATAVGVWDRGKGGAPRTKIPQRSFTYAVATHPDLVAIGNALALELYTPQLERVETIRMPDALYSLAISRDASVICGGGSQNMLVWRRGAAAVRPAAPESERIAKPRTPKTTDPAVIDWLGKVGDVSKWPGPDNAGVAALLDLIQSLEKEVDIALGALGKRANERIYNTVFAKAAKQLRGYDPEAEWSAPTSAAPMMVASIAQLTAHYAAIGWPLSRDLATLLACCADGKWPAGLTKARTLLVV